jgi:uncharacterized protein YfeS
MLKEHHMSEHDPFNEPETYAHKRARELMAEPIFWDCADEAAPFGSDEGFDAYYDWRDWREENASAPLTDCLNWICDGQLSKYTMDLASDKQVELDVESPDGAFLANQYDIFTLDTTIIATGLGQLVDEGTIDDSAKQFILVAIQRQRNPNLDYYEASTLDAIERVVNAA